MVVRIYGTDIYTGDSSICTAAVHPGKTTAVGGTDFIVLRQRDRPIAVDSGFRARSGLLSS